MDVLRDGVPPHVLLKDVARYMAGGAIARLTARQRDDDPDDRNATADRLVAATQDWLVGAH